jgi:hypothetical protein
VLVWWVPCAECGGCGVCCPVLTPEMLNQGVRGFGLVLLDVGCLLLLYQRFAALLVA